MKTESSSANAELPAAGGYIKAKRYFNTGLSIQNARLFHPVELPK